MSERRDWTAFIRPLKATETSLLKGHYLRLDARGRRSRFWYNAPVVDIQDYMAQVDLRHGLTLGCFPDATLRGVAEFRPTVAEHPQIWECTVSIEASWQNRNIRTTLLEAAAPLLAARGATRVLLCFDSLDASIGALAQRCGAMVTARESDSLAQIMLDDNTGWPQAESPARSISHLSPTPRPRPSPELH